MPELSTIHLVDNDNRPYLAKAYQDLGYIPIFIDVSGVSTDWAGNPVDALPISADAVLFIQELIERLDAVLAIDFRVNITEPEPSAVRLMKHLDDSAYGSDGEGASGITAYSYSWYYLGSRDNVTSVDVEFNDISIKESLDNAGLSSVVAQKFG
jgi:hypothetical protein